MGARAVAASVINLTPDESVELHLTSIINGAPGMDFILPLVANTTTSLAFANAPSAGVMPHSRFC